MGRPIDANGKGIPIHARGGKIVGHHPHLEPEGPPVIKTHVTKGPRDANGNYFDKKTTTTTTAGGKKTVKREERSPQYADRKWHPESWTKNQG